MIKNKYKYYILLALIGMILGMFLAFLIIFFNMTPSFGSVEISLGLILISLILSIPFHIAIHEAGHGIFGALTGYSFISYRIFDFHFQRKKNKIRVKRVHIPGTLGQCIMEPKGSWDKSKAIPYLLGGGVCNLFTALLFFVLSLELKENLGWEFFLGGSLMALFLGVSNLWPVMMQGIATDGKNIHYLLESSENKKAFWMQLKVAADLTRGKVWQDLPENYFFDFQGLYDKSGLIRWAGIMSVSFWINKNQIFRAERILTEIGREKNKLVGMAGILYYIARLELLRAKEEWQEYKLFYEQVEGKLKPMEKTEDGIYAKYIFHKYGKKEDQVADEIWEEFIKQSKLSPFPGIIEKLVDEEKQRRKKAGQNLEE